MYIGSSLLSVAADTSTSIAVLRTTVDPVDGALSRERHCFEAWIRIRSSAELQQV